MRLIDTLRATFLQPFGRRPVRDAVAAGDYEAAVRIADRYGIDHDTVTAERDDLLQQLIAYNGCSRTEYTSAFTYAADMHVDDDQLREQAVQAATMLDEGPSAEWKLQNINRIMTTYNLTRDDLGDWAADLPDEYRSADEYIADQLLRHDDPRIRESYMRYADPDTIRERVRERAEQRIQNESPFQTELAAFTDGQPDVLDLFNLSWVDDDNALEQRLNS